MVGNREMLASLDRLRRGKAILEKRNDGFRADGYTNMLNKYGTKQDNSESYRFQSEEMVSDLELMNLYEGNGLFTKIIDRPSEEAIKHGFDIDYGDDKTSEYVEEKMDALQVEEHFATAEKWARLFGGAIIVMLVDDGRGLEEPLDWNSVQSIEELRVFERSIVQPDYTSLYGFDFDITDRTRPIGQPEYYDVFSQYGTFRVHYSRCLVFRNGRLPEHTTNAIYRHWGIPEYVKIKRALRETITSHTDGVKLLERCVQAIYKMKNLSNLLTTDKGEDVVIKRMQVIDMARGILNSLAIDAEGEDYDFKTLQMSGVKDILDSTCNMLSAVTDIPQTILFGRSPAGENSTGENDMENYYSMVEKIQKMNMKSNGRTLIDLILIEGKTKGRIDEIPRYKTKFAALRSMTEEQKANVDSVKANTELVKAQTADTYVNMQAVDPSEVRKNLANKGSFEIEELVPEELNLSESLFDLNNDSDNNDDFPDHEGRPGKRGGSLPSGGSYNDRIKEAMKYKERGEDYTKPISEFKKILREAPLGTKVTVKKETFSKTGDDEYSYEWRPGEIATTTINGVGNRFEPTRKETIPEFEKIESEEVAESQVVAGKLNPEQTSIIGGTNYNGKTIEGIDRKVYSDKKTEIIKNTGKEISDQEIKRMVESTNYYTGENYMEILAASSNFGEIYSEFTSMMSEKDKAEALKKVEAIEKMIESSNKYNGTVKRAMGYDLNGELSSEKVFDKLMSQLQEGSTIDMGHISSWTTSDSIVQQLLANRAGIGDDCTKEAQVVFTCNSKTGVDIGDLSRMNQNEVLFGKNAKFRVKNVNMSDKHGYGIDKVNVHVELEEVV
ncbi:DUF1073 domain-containing protein [Enterocloster bolteae]|uniref:phage portal protein n=1 Tax=Enterocloster bolteae TaxID=208479 RepID=UPI002A7F8441|nr:DUF1073 domain-containing protein [Enterocloster bolteae]